jgi:hypothetical protein
VRPEHNRRRHYHLSPTLLDRTLDRWAELSEQQRIRVAIASLIVLTVAAAATGDPATIAW